MAPKLSKLRRMLLASLFLSLMVMPLSWDSGPRLAEPDRRTLAQIEFTPNIPTLESEATPAPILEEELDLPEIFVEGNVLVVDGKPYPIGDAFTEGAEIPTGPQKTDRTGLYGYATIQGLPGYVLLWYMDGSGERQYLVTTEDDERLTGPLGFDQMVTELQEAQDRFVTAVGSGAAAALTAIAIQVAACGPSAGAGCVTAVITAVVAAIGATITSFALIAFDLIPAFNNVARAFSAVDESAPMESP